MATAKAKITLDFTTTLTLNEQEVRALDALVGYGDTAFLKAFKEKLGEAYIRDHERGLRSAFEAIRRDVLPALGAMKQVRRDLEEAAARRYAALTAPAPKGEA